MCITRIRVFVPIEGLIISSNKRMEINTTIIMNKYLIMFWRRLMALRFGVMGNYRKS